MCSETDFTESAKIKNGFKIWGELLDGPLIWLLAEDSDTAYYQDGIRKHSRSGKEA